MKNFKKIILYSFMNGCDLWDPTKSIELSSKNLTMRTKFNFFVFKICLNFADVADSDIHRY